MRPCKAPEKLELAVKKVISVSAVGDSVIHYQLLKNFHGSVAMERQILTIAVDDLAELLETVFDRRPARAFVSEHALWASVSHVVHGSAG